MKVKIIKSKEISGMRGIESLIGNTYEVTEEFNGAVMIYIPEWEGNCSVYDGEYKIVED